MNLMLSGSIRYFFCLLVYSKSFALFFLFRCRLFRVLGVCGCFTSFLSSCRLLLYLPRFVQVLWSFLFNTVSWLLSLMYAPSSFCRSWCCCLQLLCSLTLLALQFFVLLSRFVFVPQFFVSSHYVTVHYLLLHYANWPGVACLFFCAFFSYAAYFLYTVSYPYGSVLSS